MLKPKPFFLLFAKAVKEPIEQWTNIRGHNALVSLFIVYTSYSLVHY